MFEQIEIPNKSSFKINEVCSLTGIKSYVLRFWESEFPEIAPIVSSSGHKLYEHKDIEAILLIKKLLFEDKLSVEKAKLVLKQQTPKEHILDEVHQEVYAHEELDFTKRVLKDSDVQKLVLAKNKLNETLLAIKSLQDKHHWV